MESDYTYGDNNELTNAAGTSLTYDEFGSAITFGGVSFSYDFERHMLTTTDGDPTHPDTHEYDGNGRRMRSKLAAAANWTHFIHDELTENVIAEYTLISSTFTIQSANTYGLGLVNTNRGGTKRYFHFDGLGSTAALTDGSEVVQDTYFYSAYGVLESSTGSSTNPYRFVGQWGYYDDGARGSTYGLVLLGIRYYKPDWGRFLVWDGNRRHQLYSYAKSSPTQFVDPTGRDVEICFRNVFSGLGFEGQTHYYLNTTQCGTIGMTGATYGICVSSIDDHVKPHSLGWCKRINENGELPKCNKLNLTASEEQCICEAAINAEKGWKLCGQTWLPGDYQWYTHNSQHFIIALLARCLGFIPNIAHLGHLPFTLSDCKPK